MLVELDALDDELELGEEEEAVPNYLADAVSAPASAPAQTNADPNVELDEFGLPKTKVNA